MRTSDILGQFCDMPRSRLLQLVAVQSHVSLPVDIPVPRVHDVPKDGDVSGPRHAAARELLEPEGGGLGPGGGGRLDVPQPGPGGGSGSGGLGELIRQSRYGFLAS